MAKYVYMMEIECENCNMDANYDVCTCKKIEECPWCGADIETGIIDGDDS